MSGYRVNDDAVQKARGLIDANQYVLESSWTEAAPSAGDENEHLERRGWDGFAAWHLAYDPDTSQETKQRYAFPYGDFARVHRSALIAAKQRASQNDHADVEQAADSLLQRLDETKAD